MTRPDSPWVTLATAPNPGAIALIQIHGPGAIEVMRQLTATHDWPPGRLRLVRFGDIDQGLAVMLRPDWAELMPHGGPRVVQRLLDRLAEEISDFGFRISDLKKNTPQSPESPLPNPKSEIRNPKFLRSLYPEAASHLEADMLATLARAASPAAVDLLLAQPPLWRATLQQPPDWPALHSTSNLLDQLVQPATIAVVGRPNVGKSTLTNRLLGRSASIVADLPGTTRDWVAGLAEFSGAAVRWIDTPGLRTSNDPIETRAIELSAAIVANADLVLALRDPQINWPPPADLPRTPDLWILNKSDLAPAATTGTGRHADSPLAISAQTGDGMDALQSVLLTALGWPSEFANPPLWAFSPFLRSQAAQDHAALHAYVGT